MLCSLTDYARHPTTLTSETDFAMGPTVLPAAKRKWQGAEKTGPTSLHGPDLLLLRAAPRRTTHQYGTNCWRRLLLLWLLLLLPLLLMLLLWLLLLLRLLLLLLLMLWLLLLLLPLLLPLLLLPLSAAGIRSRGLLLLQYRDLSARVGCMVRWELPTPSGVPPPGREVGSARTNACSPPAAASHPPPPDREKGIQSPLSTPGEDPLTPPPHLTQHFHYHTSRCHRQTPGSLRERFCSLGGGRSAHPPNPKPCVIPPTNLSDRPPAELDTCHLSSPRVQQTPSEPPRWSVWSSLPPAALSRCWSRPDVSLDTRTGPRCRR